MKFPKKYSQALFIFFMGFGMSIIMSFTITYINTGMDIDFLSRWVRLGWRRYHLLF
ncbi:MAG: DUF2798 domain-containing protein [Proteobacteria bacterium]|nr:DUF2798 domain-containing protein [Pseudomonadota bacterium]